MRREKKDTFCVINGLVIDSKNNVARRADGLFHFEDFSRFVEPKLNAREEMGEDWSLERQDILNAVYSELSTYMDRRNYGQKLR